MTICDIQYDDANPRVGVLSFGCSLVRATRVARKLEHEQLRDPEDAKIYLSVALEDYEKDEDIEAFLLAVRDVAEALDSMAKIAA